MSKVFKKIRKVLLGSSSALVATHSDPDGDGIGSALAMYVILKKLGIKTFLFSPDPIPKIYKFLPNVEKFDSKLPAQAAFDVALAVDCGDFKRLGLPESFLKKVKILINIDHHPDNTFFGEINLVEPAPAAAEQVFRLAEFLKIKINKEIAAALYVALMTDTGNFRYDNTKASVFGVARKLVESGADPYRIAQAVYEARTPSALKILGRALARIQTSKEGRVGWIVIDKKMMKETGALPEELGGIVDYIRSLKGVEVAVLIREDKRGLIKVNFRSKKANVSKIAERLGGGGHFKAAGAVLKGSLKGVKRKVLKTVFNFL